MELNKGTEDMEATTPGLHKICKSCMELNKGTEEIMDMDMECNKVTADMVKMDTQTRCFTMLLIKVIDQVMTIDRCTTDNTKITLGDIKMGFKEDQINTETKQITTIKEIIILTTTGMEIR